MKRGKAIGVNHDAYERCETISMIKNPELIDVLKCDVCGHSVSIDEKHTEQGYWNNFVFIETIHWYGTTYDDGDPFIITDICRLDWGGTIEALARNRQGLRSVVHILYRGKEVRA